MFQIKARDIFIVVYIIYRVLFNDKLVLLKYVMRCIDQLFDLIKEFRKR